MKMHLFLSADIEGCAKIIHHFVPLSHESLLKQQIDRCVRVIVFKRDKLETQLSILGPRRGHALKKNDQEQPALIPLIRIIFGTK